MSFNTLHLHPEPELNMNPTYREIPLSKVPMVFENSFMNNVQKFLVTDDNMKPMHVEIFAENTEFHVMRGSDTLLIVIGESWTYGESLHGVGTGAGYFNFQSQLEGCMGPRMAEVTGWDLYQFAIPGNCNLYMHMELDRILKHVSTLGYKQVKVVLQMTENSREIPIRCSKNTSTILNHGSYPLEHWFDIGINQEIDLFEWLALYDDFFLSHYHTSLNSFNACPIEGILWRNFTKLTTDKRSYNFKIIEPTMITYTGSLVNHEHISPTLMNPIQFDDFFRTIGKKIKVDMDFMEEQVRLIEKMFDYINGNVDVKNLIYHNNHPTKIGHLVWAHELIRQAGWKSI